MRIPISFNTADKNTILTNRLALKAFIEKGLKKEGITIDTLQYVFCSDKFLLNIVLEARLLHRYYQL